MDQVSLETTVLKNANSLKWLKEARGPDVEPKQKRRKKEDEQETHTLRPFK